jgi:hypothetical protein
LLPAGLLRFPNPPKKIAALITLMAGVPRSEFNSSNPGLRSVTLGYEGWAFSARTTDRNLFGLF